MNSSFSVGGWYYASSSCDQHLTFASKKEITSGYQGWEIGYNNDNNELVFSVRQGSVNERIETNNFSFDQWVHVVGVFESNSTISIYVNGQLEASASTNFIGLNDNNAPFLIGAHVNWSPFDQFEWSWKGNLDEVFIYDRSLTASEISNIYSCNSILPIQNLQGYWNFNEGSGNTILDQSGNSYDGTILNGGTYDVNTPSVSNNQSISYLDVTTCGSYDWNGETYSESGNFSYDGSNNNGQYSIKLTNSNTSGNTGDYVEIDNHLIPNDDLTVSVLVKSDSPGSTGPLFINSNGQSQQGDYSFFMQLQSSFHLHLNTIDSQGNINEQGFNGGIHTVSNGDWHFLTFTFQNGNLKTYVNGILDRDENTIGNILDINPTWFSRLGHWGNSGYIPDMTVNNIQIWNDAQSQSEIIQYMNCPPSGNETNLIGLWTFEEGSGSISYDLSNSGNNAIINGPIFDENTPPLSCNLLDINGCDSVAVLNLTINQPDTSITEVTTCESYDWNGTNYTTSGVYTFSTTNANGCDSIATLNLTINNPDTSFTNITACDSVTWNGTTYTQSGTYSYNIDNTTSNSFSMSFDGNDDYINCQNNLAGAYSSFAVEGWINISSFPSIDQGKIIDIGGPDSRIVLQTTPNQGLNFEIEANNTTIDGMASVNNLSTNEWIHVAGVWDSLSYVKVYINGIEVNSNTVSPTISSLNINSQSNVIIGARYNIQNHFHGLIDRLSVWSTALSEEEIQQYMNCPPTGNELGLVLSLIHI